MMERYPLLHWAYIVREFLWATSTNMSSVKDNTDITKELLNPVEKQPSFLKAQVYLWATVWPQVLLIR